MRISRWWRVSTRTLRTTAMVVAASFALTAAACGGDADTVSTRAPSPAAQATAEEEQPVIKGLPPTPERLAGVWVYDSPYDEPVLVRFNRDGTYAFDNHGNLNTSPGARGTYEVAGRTITFANEGGYACLAGDRWAWEAVGISEGKRLHVVNVGVAEVIDEIDSDCDRAGDETWKRGPA